MSLQVNDLIFYKCGYYIISNINERFLKIDELFSTEQESLYIQSNDEDIQIPKDGIKLFSFLKFVEKYNYKCIGTKINVNNFIIPEFEIFNKCKLTISQMYNIYYTLKNTKNNHLEIKNIIINPFLFITEEYQLLTYDKADFICKEYNLMISDTTRLHAWSYCYFLKRNNSFYVLKSKYMNDIVDFTTKKSICLDEKLINNINKTIIDKEINGNIYKTTLYLLNLEIKLTDLIIRMYYEEEEKYTIDEVLINLIIKYEINNNIQFEREQKEAILNAIQYNFSVITGPPGSGKTEIIKCINYIFYSLYKNNKESLSPKNISLIAPTGLAFVNMSRTQRSEYYNDVISGTCHKVLYKTLCDCKSHNYKNKYCIECDKPENECKYYNSFPKVFIVDESSMMDTFLFRDLLINCDYYKAKLIIIGDPNQLPSIGPGIILNKIIESNLFHVVSLTKIKRQKSGQLIRNIFKMTNDIVTVTDCIDDTMIFLSTKQFVVNDQIKKQEIIKLIQNNNLTKENSKFISYYNEKFLWNVINLNKLLQDIYNPKDNNKIPSTSRFIQPYTFRIGDKIIRCENDYSDEKNMRANGEEAIIISYKNKKVIIQYSGKNDVDKHTYIDVEILYESFKLNYCTTIHKSQGSQYDNVVFIIQPGQNIIDKKSIYTAISRAREKCIIISNPLDFVKLQTNNHNDKVSIFLEESNEFTIETEK
jgi:ATP-dependent exoDNAse (exonuclease V) alpha subunit